MVAGEEYRWNTSSHGLNLDGVKKLFLDLEIRYEDDHPVALALRRFDRKYLVESDDDEGKSLKI